MTTSLAVRLKAEPVRSLAFGSIVAGYTAIGTSIDHPARIFLLQNFTDEALMFSFDGIDDNLPLPAAGYLLIDVTANKTFDHGFYLSKGESVHVKRIGVPTSGSVYLSIFYGDTGY